MADPEYTETFVCTAIPAGIDGDELVLAVVVSPRLSSSDGQPAALSHWPNAQHWAEIEPTWKVTFTQDTAGVTATAEVDGTEAKVGPYATSAYQEMFPHDQTTKPYVPKDRQTAFIASYPVAKVRDGIKKLHVSALRTARTSFPLVTDLEKHPTFMALLESLEDEEAHSYDEIPTDEETSLAGAARALEDWHGVRPHSAGPPPTITSISPTSGPDAGGTAVTIDGTNFRTTGTVVKFGGVEATDVAVLSPMKLTCVSPMKPPAAAAVGTVVIAATGGTGTEDGTAGTEVDVRVATSAGTSPIDPHAKFTYQPPAKPDVQFSEPDVVEGGGPLPVVVLTGFHLANPISVSFKHPEIATPLAGQLVDAPDNSDTRTTVSCPKIDQLPDSTTKFIHVVGTLVTAGGSDTFEMIFYNDNGGVE